MTSKAAGKSAEPDLGLLLATDTRRVSDIAIRALDVVGAAVLLLLLSPFLAIIALAIKLDSRGPVIFWQQRLGRDLRPFKVAKFRTMGNNAATEAHRVYVERMIREGHGDGKTRPMAKIHGDPRVTRVGSFLRGTSLDELPQLWNVLVSEMSLVGPRPPIQYEVDAYPARAYRRFAVRPGITGLWQVSGRSLTTFSEMIDLDVRYVETRSLLLNLKILLLTVPTVLHGKGAE